MYLTAGDLIDMTVKQLELLADILAHDADAFASRRDTAAWNAVRCRDATAAIQTLIPKLVAARCTQESSAPARLPSCANEDRM